MGSQKMLVLGLVIILIISGFAISLGLFRDTNSGTDDTENSNGLFAGGSGTESDPYEISNVKHLQNMNENLSAHYELVDDIDASVTKNWNSGKGFVPIGYYYSWQSGFQAKRFTGTLNGQGHVISKLWINNSCPSSWNVISSHGLFGFIGENASINEVGLEHINVDGAKAGGLVGRNDGTIKNCYVTGKVNGGGGLVGWNVGLISNSYARVDVSGTSSGGLVGENGGTIKNSYATGDVSGDWTSGGLVGENGGTIKNSYATGDVGGYCGTGGLVGDNRGTITHSYATGDVNGNKSIGGLVGYNDGKILDSYSTGNVKGNERLGGLIGLNHEGTVDNSHYNIDEVLINGEHRLTIGGLFDSQFQDWMSSNKALKIEDYSDTLVPAGNHYEIRGVQGIKDLLGFTDNEEYNFSLAGDIDLSGESGLYIPYLTADFDGNGHTIRDLHLDWELGLQRGFIGYLGENGSVRDIGLLDVKISARYEVGGLVGWNNGEINTSFVTGTVEGDPSVGGLVGVNNGNLSNSYARVDVSGKSSVGGLVGWNYRRGTVINSYATGNVSCNVNRSYVGGQVNETSSIGGLIGVNYETVSNSFWDVNTTGQSSSAAGTGKTTAEMKDIDTFSNESTEGLSDAWDFVGDPNDNSGNEDVWKIDESGEINDGYPYLKGVGGYSDKTDPRNDDSEDGLLGFTILALPPSIFIVAIYSYKKKRK